MRFLLTFALALLPCHAALADAPLEPRETVKRPCSLNGRWCIDLPASPSSAGAPPPLVVEQRPRGHAAETWRLTASLIGWPAITSDGACVVDQATGSNLISLDTKSSAPAFVFHCKGRAPVVLTLDKFVANFQTLPRTTSHAMWARSFGLDQGDHLVVHTAEGRDLLIDARNGRLLEGSFAH